MRYAILPLMMLGLVACNKDSQDSGCQVGPPSFYVEPITESGVFIEEIEIDWARTGDEPVTKIPCSLGEELWECGQGQPDVYDVFLGGPGWDRTTERVTVDVPEDACNPERQTLQVKMLVEGSTGA